MAHREFHKQLDLIREQTLEMGALARSMLIDSITALKDIDEALAKEVHDRKERLAELDDIIEEKALRVLTLQQPMAQDLRFLGATVKLITYLNRVGRYGKDIALLIGDFTKSGHHGKLVHLPEMSKLVDNMLGKVMDSYRDDTPLDVEGIREAEDRLDTLRYSIYRECLSYMMEDPKTIARCTHYIMIARYLERCGDNTCKMAEKIVYMVEGERITIN